MSAALIYALETFLYSLLTFTYFILFSALILSLRFTPKRRISGAKLHLLLLAYASVLIDIPRCFDLSGIYGLVDFMTQSFLHNLCTACHLFATCVFIRSIARTLHVQLQQQMPSYYTPLLMTAPTIYALGSSVLNSMQYPNRHNSAYLSQIKGIRGLFFDFAAVIIVTVELVMFVLLRTRLGKFIKTVEEQHEKNLAGAQATAAAGAGGKQVSAGTVGTSGLGHNPQRRSSGNIQLAPIATQIALPSSIPSAVDPPSQQHQPFNRIPSVDPDTPRTPKEDEEMNMAVAPGGVGKPRSNSLQIPGEEVAIRINPSEATTQTRKLSLDEGAPTESASTKGLQLLKPRRESTGDSTINDPGAATAADDGADTPGRKNSSAGLLPPLSQRRGSSSNAGDTPPPVYAVRVNQLVVAAPGTTSPPTGHRLLVPSSAAAADGQHERTGSSTAAVPSPSTTLTISSHESRVRELRHAVRTLTILNACVMTIGFTCFALDFPESFSSATGTQLSDIKIYGPNVDHYDPTYNMFAFVQQLNLAVMVWYVWSPMLWMKKHRKEKGLEFWDVVLHGVDERVGGSRTSTIAQEPSSRHGTTQTAAAALAGGRKSKIGSTLVQQPKKAGKISSVHPQPATSSTISDAKHAWTTASSTDTTKQVAAVAEEDEDENEDSVSK